MPQKTRQLAAIMFTDIVGYTALMGKDSNKALELVSKSKQIQKPLVEKHNGEWLKEMGDGALAKFNTALDAVNCAIEIQKLARAELDAKVRIGIHSGDITIENNDVYGDGVNVAARLESLADPGGIYISEAVEKAIHGQSDVPVKYLGEKSLKNVSYKVRTYALQADGLPDPSRVQGKKKWKQHVPFPIVILALFLTIIITVTVVWLINDASRKPESHEVYRTSLLPPSNVVIEFIGDATVGVGRRVIDISDKGDKIAFIGKLENDDFVFIRNLDDFEAIPLMETKGAFACVLSPDGEQVAYFVGNTLRKIRIEKGSSQILAEVTNPMDILWDRSDIIYYGANEGTSLFKYDKTPQLVKQHRDFFCSLSKIQGTDLAIVSGDDGISIINLKSAEINELELQGSSAIYIPTGHIAYSNKANLMMVGFDVTELKITTDPVEILPGIRTETYGNAQFDVSADGTLVYIEGESTIIGALTWVNRTGVTETLPFPKEVYGQFKLSPDRTKIAAPIFGTTSDLWIHDLTTMKRFRATNQGIVTYPLWIDNNSLYVLNENNLKKIHIDRQADPEIILENVRPESINAESDKLIVGRNSDLFLFDTETDSLVNLTNSSDHFEGHGSISPDGTLVAYTSDRSNAYHVYLQQTFPRGKVVQVSKREGSEEPRWTADGKHIIYRSGQQWMEVEVLDAKTLELGSPALILQGDYINIGGYSFDITPDGQKFLMSKGTDVRTSNEIKMVKGWVEELKTFFPLEKK